MHSLKRLPYFKVNLKKWVHDLLWNFMLVSPLFFVFIHFKWDILNHHFQFQLLLFLVRKSSFYQDIPIKRISKEWTQVVTCYSLHLYTTLKLLHVCWNATLFYSLKNIKIVLLIEKHLRVLSQQTHSSEKKLTNLKNVHKEPFAGRKFNSSQCLLPNWYHS